MNNHQAAPQEPPFSSDHQHFTLRHLLKKIRQNNSTAYDVLPTGENIGSFANRHAVERYIKKINTKRERARESRKKTRKKNPNLLVVQQHSTPICGQQPN